MSLFTELQAAAFREGLNPRTKKAREWFRKKARGLTDVNKMDLISDDRLTQRNAPRPGKMFMFFYDPKTKQQLPYYDTFPLILYVESAPGGFYGLNLHYLPPAQRAKLFDALLETANNKNVEVDAPEWSIAMFLPTESFRKSGTRAVWADSRKMI